MISLLVAPLFKLRGIANPSSTLIKAGMSRSCAYNLLRGAATIRFDHLEILCRVLTCTPNDLLLFTASKEDALLAPSHPLHSLTGWQTPHLAEKLHTLPLEKLSALSRLLEEAG